MYVCLSLPIHGGATLASASWITSLGDKVALDVVEQAVVIVLDPAGAVFRTMLVGDSSWHEDTYTQMGQEATHAHSFRKFLAVTGQSSTNRSTTMSPLLVSSNTAIWLCYNLDFAALGTLINGSHHVLIACLYLLMSLFHYYLTHLQIKRFYLAEKKGKVDILPLRRRNMRPVFANRLERNIGSSVFLLF